MSTPNAFDALQQQLFENAPVSLFMKDTQGRYVAVNQAYRTLMPNLRGDAVGKTDADIFPSRAAERLMAEDRHVLEGSEPFRKIERTKLQDGRDVDLEVSLFPVHGADGKLMGELGVALDISHHVLDRDTAKRHALVFDNIYDTILMVDLSRRIIDCNPAAEALLGYTRDELIGRNITMLQPTDHGQQFMDNISNTVRAKGSWSGEILLVHKDGSEHICETIVVPLIDEQGAMIGTVGVNRDISKRKRAESMNRMHLDSLTAMVEVIARLSLEVSEDGLYRKAVMLGHEMMQFDRLRIWAYDAAGKRVRGTFSIDETAELKDDREAVEVIVPGSVMDRILHLETSTDVHECDAVGPCWHITVPVEGGERQVIGAIEADLLRGDLSDRERILDDHTVQILRNYGLALGRLLEGLRIDEALRDSEQRFRRLSEAAMDGIVVSEDGAVVDANEQFARMHGYSPDEVIGLKMPAFVADDSIDKVRERMETQDERLYEYIARRSDGSTFPAEARGRRIPYSGRTVRVAAIRDITERKRTEDTLRALSLLDDLTGLYNRRGFATLAEQQMKIAVRSGREMLLLFADLDGLKIVNDAHGHAAGDDMLRATADVLRRTFREADILGRMGGDEFTVLVVESPAQGAAALEARLNGAIAAHNGESNAPYDLAMSIGVVRFDPADPSTLHEMLTEADRLMYRAKRRKREE